MAYSGGRLGALGGAAVVWTTLTAVSKNEKFCIYNENLCIKNEEFCRRSQRAGRGRGQLLCSRLVESYGHVSSGKLLLLL